jgi:hypothetical protein
VNSSTRKRLLWAATAVEILVLGVVFWRLACPASLSLDATSHDRFVPALRGETRCWAFFLELSMVLVFTSVLANRAISRPHDASHAQHDGA